MQCWQAAEVASQIHQRHDLGVKATSELLTIDEEKRTSSRAVLQFWNALGANEICSAKGYVLFLIDWSFSSTSNSLDWLAFNHWIQHSLWPLFQENVDLREARDSLLQTDNYSRSHLLTFTGWMFFLTPNQRCLSTEGTIDQWNISLMISENFCFCYEPL